MLKINNNVSNIDQLGYRSLIIYIPFGRVFGLFENDSLKGFAAFVRAWEEPKIACLVKIEIDNKSQGKGYGCYLLLQSLLCLKKDGFSSIHVTIDPKNDRDQHIFCEKYMFESFEFKEKEYKQGSNTVVLKLDLDKWDQNS